MPETFEFTRAQLVVAFQKWNEDFENNPDNFKKEGTPEASADSLIEYLRIK